MAKFSTRNLSVSIVNQSINRVIQNLNIRVEASKTLSANPNQANIDIYNLNQNSREELFNNVYDLDNNVGNTRIVVSLEDKVLFQGDLINVNSIFSQGSSEWKTTLFCGDGFNAGRAKVNKKYDKGTSRKTIAEDLVNELAEAGVAVQGAIEGLTSCTDKSLLKAIVVNGSVMDNLKKLYSECFSSVDVYVDEGKVNTLINKAVIPNNRVLINDGLIEPPTLSEQGINCKVSLNQTIKIGAEIQVQSRSVNVSFGNLTTYRPQKSRISGDGIYRVSEIKHIVDNYSQETATTEIIGFNSGRISS